MADFASDTDESFVEEILSQARDLCVLEQVAAINCSGFSDSPLPADLDSRFRRLKSFPVTKPHTSTSAAPGRRRPEELDPRTSTRRNGAVELEEKKSDSSPASADGKGGLQQPCLRSVSLSLEEGERVSKSTRKSGKSKDIEKERSLGILTPSGSSNSSMDDDDIFAPSELNIEEKSHTKSKSKSKFGSVPSPLGSSKSWMNSPSPPRKAGCFWCSPKKDSPKRKSKENRVKGMSFDWSQQDDVLSDLGILSKKEQNKLLKKAMKEEEKINREAEKIVKMAKQASARMTVLKIEDELSDTDDESTKYI